MDSENVLPLYGDIIISEKTPSPSAPIGNDASPTTSESSHSESSYEPSIPTPSQSPELYLDGVDTTAAETGDISDDMEADDSGYLSIEHIKEDAYLSGVPKKLNDFRSSKCDSIESFGEVERLFEANYGSSVSAAVEDLYDSYTNIGYTLPDPLTVYSARVFFRISDDSLYHTSAGRAGFVDQEDTTLEEDVTDAALSSEDLSLGLSTVSLSENESAHDDGTTGSGLESSSASFTDVPANTQASTVSLTASLPSSVVSTADEHFDVSNELSVTTQEQDDSSTQSSTVSSPHDSSPGSDLCTSASSDTSPAQSSLASTPSDIVPTTVSRELTAVKKTNRSARLNTGLGIDVHTFNSPIMSLHSALAQIMNTSTVAAHREEVATTNSVSIPTIVISPVADEVEEDIVTYPTSLLVHSASLTPDGRRVPPAMPLPRLPAATYNFSLPRRLPRSPLGALPPINALPYTRTTTASTSNTSSRRPGLRVNFSTITLTTPTISNRSSRGAGLRDNVPITPTTISNTPSQRVSLRGNVPTTPTSISNTSSQRVGLRGTIPTTTISNASSRGVGLRANAPTTAAIVSDMSLRRGSLRGTNPSTTTTNASRRVSMRGVGDSRTTTATSDTSSRRVSSRGGNDSRSTTITSRRISLRGGSDSTTTTTTSDTPSRRVSLRGNIPRHRYTPTLLPNVRCFSTPGPDARSHIGEAAAPRVSLRGKVPRERFNLGGRDEDAAARERAVVAERQRARALFFAQRDAHHGSGLRPLLLPMRVTARNEGAEPAVARSWGLPF